MPHIRTVNDPGTPREKVEWLVIRDVSTDKDGYLQFFTIEFSDGIFHMHLVRHDAGSLADLASGVFLGATSLRSAKGLLEEFKKSAGRVGIAIGSVIQLHNWLKTQPFSREGYYRADGKLFLPRKIRVTNPSDYKP